MTKVSIIVPVYNDAKGLEKSIRSVISQTLKDIEIICINDGSGDDSLKILNEFAGEYDFIKVFSQENQGLSKARNFGMSKSAGEYICFLDAGDVFIDKSALENLYQFAQKNNANMVSGNIKLIDNGDEFSSCQDDCTEFGMLKPEEYEIHLSFHKNIFKREFLVNEDVIFPDLMIGQDSVFLAEILSKVNEIYTVPIYFYGHRYVDGAGQCNTREKRFDYIKHFKMVFDYLSDSKFDNVRHEYRYEMLDFINKMGVEGGKDILDASRDVFKDQPNILRNFEENFYFEHEINPEMQKLVNFTEKANPSISVLIPVYNVSEFLNDSISCLLNQTFKDIELVCVNDGSTDNSLEILNEFSKNDSRIKIINKENGGCGSARNRALDEATGDYVYLYDPDDWIELDALEKVYKSAIYNDSDMVIFKANLIENNQITNSRSYFHLNKILKKKDYKRCSFNYRDVKRAVLNMGFAPWSKLYRKEFIDSYDDFRFDLGVAFDDVPFHVKSMSRAKRISFVNEYLYHYRWDNLNSVNHKSSNSIDIFKIIDIVEGILKKEGIYEEVESDFCKFIVNHVLFYIITADSEEYFLMTKDRFSRIDEKYVPKNREKYDLVLDIDDYMEFKFEYMKVLYDETSNKLNKNIAKLTNENEKLKKKNKKLEKNNKKLKKQNKELLGSTSWKVTKPLRKLRKGF